MNRNNEKKYNENLTQVFSMKMIHFQLSHGIHVEDLYRKKDVHLEIRIDY